MAPANVTIGTRGFAGASNKLIEAMTDHLIDLLAASIPTGQHWLTGHAACYYSDLIDHPKLRCNVAPAWIWAGDPRRTEARPGVMIDVHRLSPPTKDWKEVSGDIPLTVFHADKKGEYTAFSALHPRLLSIQLTKNHVPV